MASITTMELEDLAEEKIALFAKFLDAQPPAANGESLVEIWEKLYDKDMQNVVVKTVNGNSDDESNKVFPYEKLQAIIGDGGNWKWPRMWQRFDELERRGPAYREGEKLNFGQPNKNPNITPQNVCVVGGGPIGLRLAIELKLGGHDVVVMERRREIRREDGELEVLGFTNRINRPHMWPFVRNDLAKLNGKDLMSSKAAYPVFTEPETSSIGIDELQILLLKNALLLGVDFRLGVGYDDAKIRTDPETMMPTWDVECTYDDHAAEYFGMRPGKNRMEFDCLVGCDGPRSTVRSTQGKLFGDIEKRRFMDCVGIVANVRKVSRKRLKELGFEHGQEPSDMSRTKMVFKDFFGKMSDVGVDIENLIYYKAAAHNYCIIVPRRSCLNKHGLSGKVYHFHTARNPRPGAEEEKQRMKDYVTKILHAAGIPLDDQLENGGFVDAPNDCMAFDFAECWNTKKSIVFNLPPPDYDVSEDGPWPGRKLVPFVGLCGDALLEPFWPMGLGLKRGWQAIMDTCYAVDNLYNTDITCEAARKDPEEFTWEDHYDTLQDQVAANFENCSRLKVAEDLGKGEYPDKGIVMTQLRKIYKDAEKPPLEVEIDPATRYQAAALAAGAVVKDPDWRHPVVAKAVARLEYYDQLTKIKDPDWRHPVVAKAVARLEYYDQLTKNKDGVADFEKRQLVSVSGRTLASAAPSRPAGTRKSRAVGRPSTAAAAAAAAPQQAEQEKPISISELAKRTTVTAGQAAAPPISLSQLAQRHSTVHKPAPAPEKEAAQDEPAAPSQEASASSSSRPRPASRKPEDVQEASDPVHVMPSPPTGPRARQSVAGKRAELDHIRNMISSMEKSLESYRKAEQELLETMQDES